MAKKDVLREELLWLLSCGNAHVDFDEAIADIPNPRGTLGV